MKRRKEGKSGRDRGTFFSYPYSFEKGPKRFVKAKTAAVERGKKQVPKETVCLVENEQIGGRKKGRLFALCPFSPRSHLILSFFSLCYGDSVALASFLPPTHTERAGEGEFRTNGPIDDLEDILLASAASFSHRVSFLFSVFSCHIKQINLLEKEMETISTKKNQFIKWTRY